MKNRKQMTDSVRQKVEGRCTGMEMDTIFWKPFLGFYMNRNQLSISTAYRLAKQKTQRDNPFAKIPTLRHARCRLSKVDPKEIILARYGEKPLKDSFIRYVKKDWSIFNQLGLKSQALHPVRFQLCIELSAEQIKLSEAGLLNLLGLGQEKVLSELQETLKEYPLDNTGLPDLASNLRKLAVWIQGLKNNTLQCAEESGKKKKTSAYHQDSYASKSPRPSLIFPLNSKDKQPCERPTETFPQVTPRNPYKTSCLKSGKNIHAKAVNSNKRKGAKS